MLHVVAVVAISLAVAFDGAPAQEAVKSDAKSELVALAKQVEDAPSYTFTFKSSSNAKGQEKDEDERPWTVSVQKGQPLHCVKGHADFYRQDGRYVALGKNDAWQHVELPPRTEGEPMRGEKLRGLARMAFEIDRMPTPQEIFAGLGDKLGEVTRTETDGKVEYVAQLTKDAAREMLGGKPAKGAEKAPAGGPPSGSPPPPKKKDAGEPGEAPQAPPQAGGQEGAAPPAAPLGPAWAGTMRVVAGAAGIERVEIDLQARIPSGERKVHREFDVSLVDATEVKVPEPAAKLLAQDG